MDDQYEQFDPDVIMNINGALGILTDLGVGPEEGYFITSSADTWSDFLSEEEINKIQQVKLFTYFKVRLGFDPPTNAFLVDSMERQMKELEWRVAK